MVKVTVYIRTIDPYGRGVGVLQDGTVVVVDDAVVGETVEAEVYAEMRTPAGRVLFAKRTA